MFKKFRYLSKDLTINQISNVSPLDSHIRKHAPARAHCPLRVRTRTTVTKTAATSKTMTYTFCNLTNKIKKAEFNKKKGLYCAYLAVQSRAVER